MQEQHELTMWSRRQRNLWQQGSLSQDRMQILMALGFELGAENRITEEWEFRFDQFVEWLLVSLASPSAAQEQSLSGSGCTGSHQLQSFRVADDFCQIAPRLQGSGDTGYGSDLP